MIRKLVSKKSEEKIYMNRAFGMGKKPEDICVLFQLILQGDLSSGGF